MENDPLLRMPFAKPIAGGTFQPGPAGALVGGPARSAPQQTGIPPSSPVVQQAIQHMLQVLKGPERLNYQSAVASRGTSSPMAKEAPAQMTPEASASRAAQMKQAYDEMMAAAEAKFGKPKGLKDMPRTDETGRLNYSSVTKVLKGTP